MHQMWINIMELVFGISILKWPFIHSEPESTCPNDISDYCAEILMSEQYAHDFILFFFLYTISSYHVVT